MWFTSANSPHRLALFRCSSLILRVPLMRIKDYLVASLFIALPASDACLAAETFQSLANRIPGAANAMVLIDVEQILATRIAQSGGWSEKLEVAYVERPVFLPPEAKKLALGAVLRVGADFQNQWEVAVMELTEPVAIRAIARSESGFVDEVQGVTAAFTPQDAIYADFGNNVLGVMRPAERQFFGRWIARTKESANSPLSDYLQSSLVLVNDRVQMLLAVDLHDAVAGRDIEEALSGVSWAPNDKSRVVAMADALSSLRGVALRVAIGKDCQGQLQIDFGSDTSPLREHAKEIILQALENLGMQTEELAKWDIDVAARSIRMRGDLSTDAMRRLFSVIQLPAGELQPGDSGTGNSAEPAESEVRERSLAYFKGAQVLVDDLRRGLKDTKATSAFMERYARRIDELPVLHVDELLLDYGDKLAETLRVMALSKREAGIRYGVRSTETRGTGGYYDGYYYREDAYTRAADRSQARKEEMSVAQDTRVQGWKLIEDATADIRRTLTKKYNTEF
jgi:hypothetical protein